MENNIKTFSLFVRDDENSERIADYIRQLSACPNRHLEENEDGDLVIAIGGDGTFLRAVNKTNFSKEKVYAGIHTGTLGFLQDVSENDIYAMIQYLIYQKEISTRKVLIPSISIQLSTGEKKQYKAFNEVLICGRDYTTIHFSQYIDDELLQEVSSNGIIVSSSTGDTAYSMSAGGAIDFSGNFQLIATLLTPIQNKTYPNFVLNSIICPRVVVVPKTAGNIQVIIDGIPKQISSEQIESIEVSMLNSESYINKLEIQKYSKVRIIREKILGYNR